MRFQLFFRFPEERAQLSEGPDTMNDKDAALPFPGTTDAL